MKIIIRSDHVHIEGYVNAVERLSKPITERMGTFRERIMAGAFKKALERAKDVRILENHQMNRDLGGIKDGNLRLEEDSIGLKASTDIYDETAIRDAKAGNLVGWSFGFYPLDSRDTAEGGMPIKEIYDLELVEVSLLNRDHVPAYDGTLVAVRDNETKMVVGESMMAEDIEIREDEPAKDTQEKEPEKKEVSSEYFAGYKAMIAEMKA